ncbi:MAG: undecaprenyldiphospho-muramoylpentapeptide beta-N-acetylglucosaminyltransferase [Desulfobulbus propionicus]|nr:MAG: undecaprenyldiphospho-muramoylpentapeptide beta-N-acetylglucosaminyltransferase [Desulfobulbus propionicus]
MRMVVTGGGTGGHLFPGLAVARAALTLDNTTRVLYIATPRSMDQMVLRSEPFECTTIRGSGLKGVGLAGTLQSLFIQPLAVFDAWRLLRRFRADIVVAVGGYVTGPVVFAARLLGIPVCVHEQNAVPGLANRLAGRLASVICTSIPCGEYFPADKVVQTGNPVRREILQSVRQVSTANRKKPTVLVLGGSQGAHRVNELMVEAAVLLHQRGVALEIIHQTGEKDMAMVQRTYEEAGVVATVCSFFSDMADRYSQADIVVSRAGATTLAELAVTGLPALLIPYPHAADNHQLGNAHYYARLGGCEVFEQQQTEPAVLAARLQELLADCEQRERMGACMRSAATPEATKNILKQCQMLVQKRTVT